MKSQMYRVSALGVVITVLALSTGCQHNQAQAQEPLADELVPNLTQTPQAKPAVEPPKAAPETNAPPPRMVQGPTLPDDLKVSPALAEVIKLAQAGVSDDVMLAYITNSTSTFFNVTSDAIVYLNDLGVSNDVITALIQHDSSPEMQARRQYAGAVQPLPPGAVLNEPATNIYPPSVSQVPPAQPVETTAAPVEAVTETNYVEQPASVSYFYSSLAPYGSWIDVDGYGLCWQPTVVVSNPGWRPYADNGRWLWSDYGWYWYSDYTWGWAPFHYGRWCSYPRYGWIWVPDTYWGPSWVSWRWSGSYCGWAPLPPYSYYRPGFGLYYHSWPVSVGFSFGFGWHDYCYVPVNRFCYRNPGLYYVRGDRARAIHNNATTINNYVVGDNNTIINRGIGRERIAGANRGQVPTATVREVAARADSRRERLVSDGSSLAVERPRLPESPAPSHVSLSGRPARNSAGTDVPRAAASERYRDRDAGMRLPSSRSTRTTLADAGARGAADKPIGDAASKAPADSSANVAPVRGTRSGGSEVRSARPSFAGTPKGEAPRETPKTTASAGVQKQESSANARGVARGRDELPANVAGNNAAAVRQPGRVRESQPVAPKAPNSPAPAAQSPAPAGWSAPPANRPSKGSEPRRVYANPAPSAPNVAAAQAPAARSTPSVSAPAARPNFNPGRPGAQPSQARPSYSPPARSAPGYSGGTARSSQSYSSPAVRSYAAPAARPAPSYSGRAAQSYSAPAARSAPSYSAPAGRSYSAPSFSAPSGRSASPGGHGGGGRAGGGGAGRAGGGGRGGFGNP